MQKLMLHLMGFILIGLASCSHCEICEIKQKETQDVLLTDHEICGTEDELSDQKGELDNNYNCIECIVTTSNGPVSTGYSCGDRSYTDSLEAAVMTGATAAGLQYFCTLYRDTLEVTCVLKP